MHVGDLLHAQPAELAGAHGAVHAVAAAIVGLHDVSAAARARLDLLRIYGNRRGRREGEGDMCFYIMVQHLAFGLHAMSLPVFLFFVCKHVLTIILHYYFNFYFPLLSFSDSEWRLCFKEAL